MLDTNNPKKVNRSLPNLNLLYSNPYALFSLIFISIFYIFKYRYLAGNTGFPGQDWDYGSHIAIINHILEGDFFPELHKLQTSMHSITPWLPIYHGIIGTHLAAALLVKFGFSIPVAMLIVSDFSLILIFVSLYRFSKNKIRVLVIFFILIVPAYSIMVFQGFYSLVVGSSLSFCALVFFLNKQKNIALTLFTLSFFCYPDFAIWLFLYGSWYYYKQENRSLFQKYIAYIFLLIAGSLYIVIFVRSIYLRGGMEWPLTYILILLFLVFSQERASKKIGLTIVQKLTFIYLIISLSLLIIPLVTYGYSSVYSFYYPVKYTYWSIFFISLLLLKFTWPKYVLIIVFFILIFGILSDLRLYHDSLNSVLFADSKFTSNDELEIRNIKKYNKCNNYFFIPQDNNRGVVESIAVYSYLNKYDIYNTTISNNINLPESNDQIDEVTDEYSGNDIKLKKLILHIIENKIDTCLIVAARHRKLADLFAENKIEQNKKYLLYNFKKE